MDGVSGLRSTPGTYSPLFPVRGIPGVVVYTPSTTSRPLDGPRGPPRRRATGGCLVSPDNTQESRGPETSPRPADVSARPTLSVRPDGALPVWVRTVVDHVSIWGPGPRHRKDRSYVRDVVFSRRALFVRHSRPLGYTLNRPSDPVPVRNIQVNGGRKA